MAAQKKYSRKALREAVENYFASISRMVPITERVDTGEKDEYGHTVYKERPVVNQLGKQVQVLEYLVKPTISGLCLHLHIHRSTWDEYCDHTTHPEFEDITTQAVELIRADRDQRLLTEKNVKGVIFDLQVNHGCQAKTEIELGPRGAAAVAASSIPASERAALLREIAEEFSEEDGEGGG